MTPAILQHVGRPGGGRNHRNADDKMPKGHDLKHVVTNGHGSKQVVNKTPGADRWQQKGNVVWYGGGQPEVWTPAATILPRSKLVDHVGIEDFASAVAAPAGASSETLADLRVTGLQAEAAPAVTQPRRKAQQTRRDTAAVEALRTLVLGNGSSSVSDVAALMSAYFEREDQRRPRHAAVALAVFDVMMCNADPLSSAQRKAALWSAARLLLSRLITTQAEMSLLDAFDAAGLERVPPFEDTAYAAFDPLLE